MADLQLKDALNEDGSLVTDPATPSVGESYTIKVGVLAEDDQHGDRGGGTLHAEADSDTAGFMSTAHVAALDAATAHGSNTSNPHSVTKTQVGLSAVTDDAQLKRADGDFATFTAKTTPVGADITLIEDSAASGAKKKSTLAQIFAALLGNVTNDAQLKRAGADFTSFTAKTTPVAADTLLIEDSASADAKKKATVGNVLSVLGLTGLWMTGIADATSSASALTDRFPGSSLDSKWLTWDPGSYLTATVSRRRLLLAQASHGTTERASAVYQAVPSTSEYAIIANMGFLGVVGGYQCLGIFIAEALTGNSTTALMITAEMFSRNPSAPQMYARTRVYNAAPTDLYVSPAGDAVSTQWVRIRCSVSGSTTTYYIDHGPNGRDWTQVYTSTRNNIAHCGVMYNNYNGATGNKAVCHGFYVFEGSGMSTMDGAYIGKELV